MKLSKKFQTNKLRVKTFQIDDLVAWLKLKQFSFAAKVYLRIKMILDEFTNIEYDRFNLTESVYCFKGNNYFQVRTD